MPETVAVPDWQAWQDSWDRQQEWYLPDREERFRAMLDTVEALVPDGSTPRINQAEREYRGAQRARAKERGVQDWGQWWLAAAREPALAAQVAERFEVLGDPTNGDDHVRHRLYDAARHAPGAAGRGVRRGAAGVVLGH